MRYRFKPRWGAVAFLEAGWFDEEVKQLGSGRRITSYGAGVRWQVTPDKKLNLGFDVAISTDEKAAYIQVGEQF
jgi:outer membrane translocation and assembly module TamA